MPSPAQASFQRKLAAMAGAPVRSTAGAPPMPESGPVASEYQLLLAALGEDLRQLHQIQGTERKIEAKRGMIARYLPWVEGALSAETAAQDEIVVTMLIWAIDLADWPLAIQLAGHVLAHNLALPERYKRQPATLIAEEFAEAGLATPPGIDLTHLNYVFELVAAHDLFDQVRAKLHKAIGLALKTQADAFDPEADNAVAGGKPAMLEAAVVHFRTALGLDKGSGVKKLIETTERELKKLAEPAG